MAESVFSSVRAALCAGMTTMTLASALALGMAREDTSGYPRTRPFSPCVPRVCRVLGGVKEWPAIQERATLRARADELTAGRDGARFLRRRREGLTSDDEQLTARAVREAKTGDGDAIRYLYLRYADHVYGYLRSIVRD